MKAIERYAIRHNFKIRHLSIECMDTGYLWTVINRISSIIEKRNHALVYTNAEALRAFYRASAHARLGNISRAYKHLDDFCRLDNRTKSKSKTLKLTLRKKWFDMILSGKKKEEYRDIKPHWESRLMEITPELIMRFRQFDFVEFRNGYSARSPYMKVQCRGIGIGLSKSKWSEKTQRCYVISLGKIVKKKYIKTKKS
jgi:hypothetical protein